jgi:hypothetical protein
MASAHSGACVEASHAMDPVTFFLFHQNDVDSGALA